MAGCFLVLLTMGSVFSEETFTRDLQDRIIAFYDLDPANTEVEIRRCRLELAPDEYDSLAVAPLSKAEPRGLLALEVTPYKDDTPLATEQARIKISRFADVLVSSKHVKRHETLTAEMFIIDRREITSISDQPLVDPVAVLGLRSKRTVNKNHILTASMVEKIPDVSIGQEVAIVFSLGGLEVSGRGTAVESGYIGEQIKVKNKQSKKMIVGTIADGQSVSVSTL